MHVVQLTPRGSGCSIVSVTCRPERDGARLDAGPAAGRRRRGGGLARSSPIGVECSEITVFDERDGGTFFGFSDPDGNTLGRPADQGPGREALDPGRLPEPVWRRCRALIRSRRRGDLGEQALRDDLVAAPDAGRHLAPELDRSPFVEQPDPERHAAPVLDRATDPGPAVRPALIEALAPVSRAGASSYGRATCGTSARR